MKGTLTHAWQRFAVRGGLFALVAAAFVVAIVALAVSLAFNEKRYIEARARQEAQNLSRMFAASALETISKCDLALRLVAIDYRKELARASFDEPAFERMLAQIRASLPEIASLRVLDSRGLARFGPGLPPRHAVSPADRADFQRLKLDPRAGLVISSPAVSWITGDPGIVLSRRLEAPDGSFAGAVSIGLTSASFHRLVAGLELDRLDHVTLLDANARLIYRYPAPPDLAELIGGEEASPPLRALIGAGRTDGNASAVMSDGTPHFEAQRSVGKYPINVVARVAATGDLAAWQRRTTMQALFVLLVWLGIITTEFLRKYRRHAIVLIFVIAAIVTPTPDPFTQTLFAAPLYALFEISILVSTRVEKRKKIARV